MKKIRFKLFIYLLAAVTLYAACHKADRMAEGPPAVNVEGKFFSAHASNDPLVQSIARKMQRENQQQPFIETIIRRVGYPQWDKSMIVSKQGGRTSGRGNTADSVEIVYIPFVRDSQNYVNASLLFKVSPSDTSYQYLLDWQYESYGFDTTGTDWNARDVFHLFANFDRNVFGRTTFKITDGRIFGDAADEGRYITLRPQTGTGNLQDILVYVIDCDIEDHCWAPPGIPKCEACDPDCYQFTNSVVTCTSGWVEDGWVPAGGGNTGGPGGGTGGGTTGGGSGGGGGYTPPQCPGVAARAEVVPNCSSGWVPVGGGGGGGGSATTEPIDSMLKRYYTAIKSRTDSLLAKSLRLNWEHSMIIVKKGDSIYLKNEKTSQDSMSTTVDFTLAPGEVLLGYTHCHSSSSSNVKDRSAPSGSDVKFLKEKVVKNFVQITECGNATYAMVIEDSAKATTFLDSLYRLNLNTMLEDSAQTVTGWFFDWQGATQSTLVNVMGTAGLHGIGFYKSTDPIRKSWIKLNP